MGVSQFEPPPGQKEAKRVVAYGSFFLLILVAFYTALHFCPKVPSYDKKNAADFFETIGTVKATLAESKLIAKDVREAVDRLNALKSDPFTSEFSESTALLKGTVTVKAFKDGAELKQNDQRVVELRTSVDAMERKALGIARNDGFFWTTGYWRWLEIVFWGEFGVLTGILVWVSMELEKGKYSRRVYLREVYWYITEVVIGPVVVVAVFFLLKQFIGTIIEGVTYEQVHGSVYTMLGLSFILGYSMRRTLGILDAIKNKLPLPEKKKEEEE